MVKFKNDSESLQFSILNYQFPNQTKDYDGNWLLVQIDVSSSKKIFSKQDPALLNSELLELAKWFEDISNEKIPEYTNLTFVEPNFEFSLHSNKNGLIRFSIKLSLELKPTFAKFDEDYIMVFEYSKHKLLKISRQLRIEYEKFPKR